MAKLVLSIQPKDEGALKSVQALKAEVQSLSKSLSSIKVAASGVETTRKGYANLITTLKTLKSQYADGVFGTLQQDAERAFERIQEISSAFQENGKITKAQTKEYAQLSQLLKKLAADLATVKAKNDKIVAANPFTITQAQQIPRLIKQYSTLLNTIKSTEKYYPKGTFDTFKADLTQGQADLQALNNEFQTTGTLSQESQAKLNALANGFLQVNAAVAKTTSTMKSSKGGLLDIINGFAKFQLSAMLVMKPLQWIRSALSSINETLVKTEDAVIALQRVLPSGSATDDEISGKVYDIAQRYGQTFENVSQIATNFARTGMSWADTIKATEAAVLALNVAELDATEASEGLISILTQFEMTADQLTEVVDKLNKAADKNPVTTEKLLTALQRTGAAAKNANITLDETIGIITTLSKATNRSGENLGTAVNSLIQFSSKESSLDTFAKFGGDVEVAVEKFRAGAGSILEIWEELGKVIQNRQGEAESILGGGLFNNEEWAQLNDELKEALGESYADITDIYNTASVFRRNYFVALLNDMDNVKKVTGEIADANGYSQAENEKYLNTYTAKLNSLKAQWEDIANDEQGLLGIKKDLVDMASGVLKIVEGVGGLKTAFVALGVVVGSLLMAFKGEAILATLTKIGTVLKSLTIDAIPNFIAVLRAWEGKVTTLSGKVVQLNISTATFGQVVKAALPIITAIIIAMSALDTAMRRDAEARAEAERKAREEQDAAISKSNERVDTQKKEVQSMEEVAASVENLRNVLDSSIASEDEKRKAQAQLLQIQSSLIESNNAYKDSLDLTNGSLKEQLGLIEQLTSEQLKQKARDFISQNKSAIEIAQSRLESQSTTNTDMLFSGYGNDRFRFRDIISKAIQGAGVENFADIIEDNVYGYIHKYFKDIFESDGFWDGVGNFFNVFDDLFTAEGWAGSASAGFSFSGTIEEQINAIKELQKYIAENRDELGLTAEEHTRINSELERQLDLLDTEEYKQAELLEERAKATQDFLNGTITEAEYLEKVYGITKKAADETGEWHNNIAKVTDEYDKLIDKLKDLRDAQKESLDLEEKKKDYLEAQNELIKAQQALENAKHEATVRRYNQTTGQWEWQVDEKKVAEAEEEVKDREEDVEEARQNLEKQAYDTIIDQLENNVATNDGLNALLDGLIEYLGEDFIKGIKAAVLVSTDVDLDKPINETPTGTDKPVDENPATQPSAPDNHGIQVLKNSDGSYATGKGISKDKIGDNGEVTWNGKTYKIENGGASTDQELAKFVAELGLPDRTIFAYNGSIYGVLDGGIVKLQARANSYGDKSDKGYKALSDAVTGEFGSYDSGGAAIGKGFMPKATDEVETVNDPVLTAKILSPVSNERFDRWVRDQGILFETARRYAQSPVIERVGGATDNRVDNSGQIIMNGVSIGSDKRASSLDEILALGGIIPKV